MCPCLCLCSAVLCCALLSSLRFQIVDMLNKYFGYMIDALMEEGGILDKFIGDAIMAVFGVPSLADDGAVHCRRDSLLLDLRAAAACRSTHLHPLATGAWAG